MAPGSSEAAGGCAAGEAGDGDRPRPAAPRGVVKQAGPGAPEEPVTDGRRARGQRTRRAVGDALVALLTEGDGDPTAKAVAARAGVSLRLVFHHFSDMDDLYGHIAVLRLQHRAQDLPAPSPRLPLVRRVERTVSHRGAFFEDVSPVRRALARREPSSPVVRTALRTTDHLLLQQLEATFAPELAAVPVRTRAECLGAMDTATSWEAWERLRSVSGLQVRATKRVMARMLTALCAQRPHTTTGTAADPVRAT